MYNISELVSEDKAVFAGASLFPVHAAMGGAGLSGTRFVLAQVPGTADSPEWVACVWASNPTGGTPTLHIAEKVDTIAVFTPQHISLLLEDGRILSVTPTGGCGCGSRLRSWQPWGPSVRLHQVPRPPATT